MKIPIVLAILLEWLIAPAALAADYHSDWHTVDSGGDRSTGGRYTLHGTIAQPDANTTSLSGGNYQLDGGFWVRSRPYVELSITDVTVAEGYADTTTAQLSVNLNKPSYSSGVTVNYATADDTAKAGSDYTAITTTPLTFAPGEATQTITVTINSDSLYEVTDETLFVNLSNISANAKLIDPQGVATITEDDSPPSVALSLSNETFSENGGTTTVTATLSNPTIQAVTIELGFSGADSGTDYTVSATSITIPAGELSASVTLIGLDDSQYEDNETLTVEITSVTNGTEDGTQLLMASIIDDEILPTVQFANSDQTGVENADTLTVIVELSAASNLDIEVPFTVTGTATPTADYHITASPILFSAGTTTASIMITPVDDSVFEADETVIVTLGTPTHAATAGNIVHTATVTDDEMAPTVQFTVASQTEAENVGTMTLIAELSTILTEEVTIPFSVDGSATDGMDYTITSSPISIAAGSTTAEITLTVNEDNEDEPNETVTVTIGTPTNATAFGTTAHTATIEDNDVSLVLNEIDYDQGAIDTAEFIEIKNISGRTLDLTEYTLQLINSEGSSSYQTIDLSGSLAADDYYVICTNITKVSYCDQPVFPDTDFIQDGSPHAISLHKGSFVVDMVSYDGNTPNYTETSGAPADNEIQVSLSRYADGIDTNNNSVDLGLYCITPGAANISTTSSDCAGPTLLEDGYPKVANVTDKSLDLLVKSQGDGNISYVLLPKGAPAPTPEQIRAGLDSNGNPIGLSGDVAVTDGTQNVVNVTGLSPGVEYEIFVVDQSGSGTGEDEITQITTSTVPADPPPPSFDVGYPKVANVTDKSLDLLVKSQGDGNISYVLLPKGAPAPTPEQIRAGLDSNGNPIGLSGSVAVTDGTQNVVNVTGLSPGVEYEIFVVDQSSSGTGEDEITQITTSTVPADPPPPSFDVGYPKVANVTDKSLDLLVKSQGDGNISYVLLPKGTPASTPEQIRAGLDSNGNPIGLSGSVAVTDGTQNVVNVTGLSPGVEYEIFVVDQSSSGTGEDEITQITTSTVPADPPPPSFDVGYPKVANVTDKSLDLLVKSQGDGNISYVLLPKGAPAPTPEQIRAGLDSNGNPIGLSGDVAVTDGTKNVINVTGLSPGVEYEIFVVDQSGSGTGEDEITQITTSTVPADPPPPSFDVGYPKVANVTDKSLDLLVKSQGDGNISYVLLPKGAPAPTPEQIRAGLDSNGNPIGLSGDVAVTDGTKNVVNVTGLSPGVEYEIFVVDQSGSGTGEDEITQITTSTVPADPPPPSFDVGYPKVANVTDKSLDLLVKSQGDGNISYVLLPKGAPAPTPEQIRAGLDSNGNPIGLSGSVAVTDGTQNVVNVTGLSPGVEYEIFVVDQSGSGSSGDEITQITTSTVPADPPPPSFDVGYPKVANVTDKSLDLLVKSQGDGNISYVLLPKGAPAPTPEQIRAGLDSNGNPIGLSGSVAVTDGTQNVVNVTGLSPGVEYEIFVVDQSGSGSSGDEITQITTSTVPADPPPPSFDVGYPKVANVTDKSLDLLVKSQGDGNISYVLLPKGAPAPTPEQIRAGLDSNGNPIGLSGSVAVTDGTQNVVNVTGLSPGVEYEIFVVDQSGSGTGEDKITQITTSTVPADPPPPSFDVGYPKVANVTDKSLDLLVKSQGDGNISYVLLPKGAPAPTPEQIRAGLDSNGNPIGLSGGVALTGDTPAVINVTGLSPGVEYEIFIVDQSDNGSGSATDSLTKISANTTTAPADKTVPPVETGYSKVANVTDNSLDLLVETKEAGKISYVILPKGATAPTPEQIRAGQDSNGNSVGLSGAAAFQGNRQSAINITGLTPGVDYDIFVVAEDNNGNPTLLQTMNVTSQAETTLAESALCPTRGTLNIPCNAGGQTITELKILKYGHLSNGVLKGEIILNEGWASNLTITASGVLKGCQDNCQNGKVGKVSGYIINYGTMSDFEFRGRELKGGRLSGNIKNTSQVGGYIQDVELAANTRIEGGKLVGQIRGEVNAPAWLYDLEIDDGSQLSGVVICDGVQLPQSVSYGDGVSFCKWKDLPADWKTIPSLAKITPYGDVEQQDYFDLNSSVVVDDKTILEAINDLPEIAEYGLVVYQNPDFGYIYVDVGDIRFGLNPFEVQHPRRTEILVHYELGQTVYSNTDIDVEVFTQPAIQEPVELQRILAEWGLPFVHVDELGNLRVSASETDEVWYSARPNWVSELVDDATEIGLFLPIPTAAFSVFVDELGQKRAQLFYPVPADMSALIESAREVDFTPEGFFALRSEWSVL